MAVRIKCTNVACDTAPGAQDITIDGFGIPKAALFILSPVTVDGTPVNGAAIAYGGTDGTNQWSFGQSSEHGQATSDTFRSQYDNACIVLPDGSGAEDGSAAFTAWIPNGVRITWSVAPAAAYRMTVVLFGGADLLVDAHTFTLGLEDAEVNVEAPGFEPDLLMVFSACGSIGNQVDADGARQSIGFVHNGDSVTQYGIAHGDRDGAADTTLRSEIYDIGGWGLSYRYSARMYAIFSNFDAAGYSATAKVASGAAIDLGVLAFKFPPGYNVWLGNILTPAGTGNEEKTDPGFQPDFIMGCFGDNWSLNTALGAPAATHWGLSVYDGAVQWCHRGISEDSAATSNTESGALSSMIAVTDDEGGPLITGTMVSMNPNGWTWNLTATLGSRNWPILALGNGGGSAHRSLDHFRRRSKKTLRNHPTHV